MGLGISNGDGALENAGGLALGGFCICGAISPAYLTFPEPFVIGVTCMWCIGSAVLIVALLWVATPFAREALGSDADDGESDDPAEIG